MFDDSSGKEEEKTFNETGINGTTAVIVAGNKKCFVISFILKVLLRLLLCRDLTADVSPALDFSASAGSRVVVVTANAWSSEQSYISVVQTNVDLYRGIIPSLARLSPNAVMLIASQPGRYQ